MRELLQGHLELQRYRELTDITDSELDRLLTAARGDARELLGTLGYFSPEIRITAAPAPLPSAGTPPRTVRIDIDPGGPTLVREVRLAFSGPMADDPAARPQREQIESSWTLPVGRRFTQAGWNAAKQQALRQLTARRYPTGRLAATRADIDPDTRSAHLVVTLDSGPAYRLGALDVSGVERYDAEMVTRLARLQPGSDYEQARLVEAQQRLSDSGYFDSVFVSLDTAGDPAAAPVRVQLREARRQKLVLGIGASTDSGARLSVEHTHHQLPGLGWRAVSKLSFDRETQSVGTELTAPPDADNWRWVTSALVKREQAASYEVSSQRLRFGRTQSGERIDRNVYLQYDRARTSGGGSVELASALSANYAFTLRNFDHLPFPSSGWGLGVELGGGSTLGAQRDPFGRVLARALAYWPLDGSGDAGTAARAGRLALRAETGAVLARSGATLPSTQLFLAGGDNSVRGYAYRDIGVLQPDGTTAPGRYLAVGSVEWQRPITRDGRLTDWEGTLFVDAGAVADQASALRARVGVGAGVRWKSPVGPLQIDLAYGVKVRRLRLHLNVGFSF